MFAPPLAPPPSLLTSSAMQLPPVGMDPLSSLSSNVHQYQLMLLHRRMHQQAYPIATSNGLVLSSASSLFDKMQKLDSPFYRPGVPGLSHPALSPMLPQAGIGLPGSGLPGAFQPKNRLTDPGAPSGMHHTQLLVAFRDREKAAAAAVTGSGAGQGPPSSVNPVKKPGKWCAAHVRIAWEIHILQQKQQAEIQRGGDVKSQPPGVGPGGDMLRPPSHLLAGASGGMPPRPDLPGVSSASLLAHAAHSRSPFEQSHPGHPGLFSSAHLGMSPFPRPSPYHNPVLSGLNSAAFGGLGNIGGSLYGRSEMPFPGMASPHEWSRLHRTPPSFPTPPAWPPKASDIDAKDREREKERERERERDLRERERERERERDVEREREREKDSRDRERERERERERSREHHHSHRDRERDVMMPRTGSRDGHVHGQHRGSSRDRERDHSLPREDRERDRDREIREKERERDLAVRASPTRPDLSRRHYDNDRSRDLHPAERHDRMERSRSRSPLRNGPNSSHSHKMDRLLGNCLDRSGSGSGSVRVKEERKEDVLILEEAERRGALEAPDRRSASASSAASDLHRNTHSAGSGGGGGDKPPPDLPPHSMAGVGYPMHDRRPPFPSHMPHPGGPGSVGPGGGPPGLWNMFERPMLEQEREQLLRRMSLSPLDAERLREHQDLMLRDQALRRLERDRAMAAAVSAAAAVASEASPDRAKVPPPPLRSAEAFFLSGLPTNSLFAHHHHQQHGGGGLPPPHMGSHMAGGHLGALPPPPMPPMPRSASSSSPVFVNNNHTNNSSSKSNSPTGSMGAPPPLIPSTAAHGPPASPSPKPAKTKAPSPISHSPLDVSTVKAAAKVETATANGHDSEAQSR